MLTREIIGYARAFLIHPITNNTCAVCRLPNPSKYVICIENPNTINTYLVCLVLVPCAKNIKVISMRCYTEQE